MRLVYVSSGGADLVGARRNRRAGVDDPSQVSLTFSGQVEQAIEELGADGLLLSFREDGASETDGRLTIRHLAAKARGGARYHAEMVRRGWQVLRLARGFRADVAVVDSGAVPYYLLPLFGAAGLRVVTILHNALWPAGFPPSSAKDRLVGRLDALYWRRAGPVLSVAPEGARQVRAAGKREQDDVRVFAPMFRRELFASVPPPPDAAPFNVLFVGRAVRNKGLLMLPDMAARTEAACPGALRWTVCGDGPDLGELRRTVSERGLDRLFDIRGWTSPAELRRLYADVHAVVVPTTSGFNEGLAMTAVEAVLAGRPVVTSPVVPALELLRDAAAEAVPDDAGSFADAVLALASDHDGYERRRRACAPLAERFYDQRNGLTAKLCETIRALPAR